MNRIKLGDICTKASSNIKQSDLVDNEGNYPIYGASGFIKNVDFYMQEKPYVAVVKDGAGVGRVMKLPAYSSVIGTMQYIIPNDGVDVSFLAYAMEHMNLSKYYMGAAIPHIYFKDYKEEMLYSYNLESQLEIVNRLNAVEKIIKARKEQAEKLDELIKSRFIEMFCGLDKWKYVFIRDICTDMRTGPFGSSLHHDEFVDNGVFVLGIDNAVDNEFSYNRMRYITEEKYLQLKRYTVQPLDVIITIMGTVGRSAVIPEDIPLAINTKHLACLTLNKSIANPYFVAKTFQIHPEILYQLSLNSKGAIMDGLNLTIIKGLKFRLPPIDLQNQFANFVTKVEQQKATVQKSINRLETLKKSLMQEYFG